MTFVVVAAAAAAMPTRQIGEVVSAICAPPNGTAFCVAGLVANQTGTTTKATGIHVVGNWNFTNVRRGTLVPGFACSRDPEVCIHNGSVTDFDFGNLSFVIDLRMRVNSSRETSLLGGSSWQMSMHSEGTLEFRFAADPGLFYFKVKSHKVINDGEWHNVRFSRTGVSDFAFSFDDELENNITLVLPKDNVVDISTRYEGFYGPFFVDFWKASQKYPSGVQIDTLSISMGEHLTNDLFSFDTTTGSNVVLDGFLVNKFGCARNSSLCKSCSFCHLDYSLPAKRTDIFADGAGEEPITFRWPETTRAACTATQFFVPREEGACCGRCVYPNVKFCKYRSGCMPEFVSAHECKRCGALNAEIKCAQEQSVACGQQTQALCKFKEALGQHNQSCNCDGEIEKLPASALAMACTNITTVLNVTCWNSDGSLGHQKEGPVAFFLNCTRRNGGVYNLDATGTCWSLEERKRHSFAPCSDQPMQETPTTTTANASAAATLHHTDVVQVSLFSLLIVVFAV